MASPRPRSGLVGALVTLAWLALGACGTDGAIDPEDGSDASVADGSSPDDAGRITPDAPRPADVDATSSVEAGVDADAGADAAAPTFPVGGTLEGVTVGGLVLVNGNDTLPVPQGATTFTFATRLPASALYDVKVKAQPSELRCSVVRGSGTVTGPVSDVHVGCVPSASPSWSIGGTVTGLVGSGLVLTNAGADAIGVAAGAKTFAFPTRLTTGAPYLVEVATQPSSPAQTCAVTQGSGNAAADVSDVGVACSTNTYAVGGTVEGLAPGASVTLATPGAPDLVVAGNGAFAFATPIASGTPYDVKVKAAPAGQTCLVTSGSGTVTSAPITSVEVTCSSSTAITRVPVGPGLGNVTLAAGNFAALPLLSQTGVFSDLAALTPHPALVPFAPNTQLWSDAAVKARWVALPNDGAPYGASERVVFSATGLWTFPVGTVTVKQFDLVVNEVTGQRKRLETRVGVLLANGTFKGASYRWRADGSDADLVSAVATEQNTIVTANGSRTQTHTYPDQGSCTQCHRTTSGFALGLRTAQLNGDLAYPSGTTINQLRAWGRSGMFEGAFDENAVAGYLRTVPITDVAASLETRSRSYFEANCSSCHHPGGPNTAWDARFSTPLGQQGILNQEVKPGDPASSKLYQRMSYAAVDTPQKVGQMMPPIAKNHVDTYALGVVYDWILGL